MADLMAEFVIEFETYLSNYFGFETGSPTEDLILYCTAILIFVFIMYLTIKFLVRTLW